jgi:hypothetical protein
LGISGIGCDDFNATVYDLAMDSIVQNSTFSDAGCEQPDESTSFVVISNEVSLPLAIAVRVGSSVHEFVTDVLNQSVVEARFLVFTPGAGAAGGWADRGCVVVQKVAYPSCGTNNAS